MTKINTVKYNVSIICMVDECIYRYIDKNKTLTKCLSCVERGVVTAKEIVEND